MKTKRFAAGSLAAALAWSWIIPQLPAFTPKPLKASAAEDFTDYNIVFGDNTKGQDLDDARYGDLKTSVSVKSKMSDLSGVTWKCLKGSPAYGDVRAVMESSKSDDAYIKLGSNLEYRFGRTDVKAMKITSDKVLDLNGHYLDVYDFRNKKDGSNAYGQSPDSEDFISNLFTIEQGATLTIIDSSATASSPGKGWIRNHGYMIDPYEHEMKRYTTRDIFYVNDGNLVIYDGTFKAGRTKVQWKDETWDNVKVIVGNAVELGCSIAEYATGLNAASGVLKDEEDYMKALEEAKAKKKNNTSEDEDTTKLGSTPTDKMKNNPEVQNATPNDVARDGAKDGTGQSAGDRNPTNSEKEAMKESTGSGKPPTDFKTKDDTKDTSDKDANKGNDKNKADPDKPTRSDQNEKIAKAENDIVTKAFNVSGMVDKGFQLAESIIKCFKQTDNITTQAILGTVVKVGNAGTFVSYGGSYVGTGMTPNVRNAVVESTKDGRVYIYDGSFEAVAGANVFNIYRTNGGTQEAVQFEKNEDGSYKQSTVYMDQSETAYTEVLYLETDPKTGEPKMVDGKYVRVNTGNIQVRGGDFSCSASAMMVGLHDSNNEMTVFPGNMGAVNLGVESYNENFIRDGRIQIDDVYGDGALVLIDDVPDPASQINQFRLFCTDSELRSKWYLSVYPNPSQINSTHSFALVNTFENDDTDNFHAKNWVDDEMNDRSVYGNTELFFEYPLNSNSSDKYYVVPRLDGQKPFALGSEIMNSPVWYYNTPIDAKGNIISPMRYGYKAGLFEDELSDRTITLVRNDNIKTDLSNAGFYTDKQIENSTTAFVSKYLSNIDGSAAFGAYTQNFHTNVKWITYKVYRVDPLTRENISLDNIEDVPLLEAKYGSTDGSLKVQLPIDMLNKQIGFQAGEMYRIVLSVEEYFQKGAAINSPKDLATAKNSSSIVFVCYDESKELFDDGSDTYVKEFTPLQWVIEPAVNKTAKVTIKNGWAGKVDFLGRKMFDIYYQWYVKGENGQPDELIAGTDRVFTAPRKNYNDHHISMFNFNGGGYLYRNTIDPADTSYPSSVDPVTHLPTDKSKITIQMLHMSNSLDVKQADLMLYPTTSNKPTLKNNVREYGNTDTCYIPDDYAGRTIYCRAVAVNMFWPVNYDHVQVFKSHEVKLGESSGVKITEEFFPDVKFRSIISTYDTNKNGILTDSEINAVTKLSISADYGIKSVKGIEYLKKLKTVSISNNPIGSIDLSQNTLIESLTLSNTSLYSIDLSKNTALKSLTLTGCDIQQLDLKNLKKLTSLDLSRTKITELNTYYQSELMFLRAENCLLRSVSLSNSQKLTNIYLKNNHLTDFLMNEFNDLVVVDLSYNKLIACTLWNWDCPKLIYLDVSHNEIMSMNLSYLESLSYVDCSYNDLKWINISDSKIQQLNCDHNKLVEFDPDNEISDLTTLSLVGNNLRTLDLSGKTKLKSVDCSSNGLACLNVPANCTSVKANYNVYIVPADTESISTGNISGFDVSKASNIQGGVIRNGAVVFNGDSITYTYNCGNNLKNTFTIERNNLVKFTKQPEDVTVSRYGDTAVLTAQAEGEMASYAFDNDLHYYWVIEEADGTNFNSKWGGSEYSVKVNESAVGRKYYCKIYDVWGNEFVSDVVKVHIRPEITRQPKSVNIDSLGSECSVSVGAQGEELSYEWFYMNDGDAEFTKSDVTSAAYTVEVGDVCLGRTVYCEITDKYGNKLTSDTAHIGFKGISIVEQPADVSVAKAGDAATISVTAIGEELSYQWYYKNPSNTKFYAASGNSSTYSYEITTARNGRQMYCVITDKYGNTVQTDTVTMTIAPASGITITEQPVDVSVAKAGDKGYISVSATGDELTYLWYYKNPTDSKFSATSVKSSKYSIAVTSARDGRQMYCIITDKYGNTVQTDTVTMTIAPASGITITEQPVDVSVAKAGDSATISVTAVGEELSYQWYYKNPSNTKFYAASGNSSTYSYEITNARNGRQMYCVITDKYGNTVQTDTVTMTIASGITITEQPVDVSVAKAGDKGYISVSATGDELTYLWYYKNPADSKFSATSVKSSKYSIAVTSARDGRQMYCIITDKYGNKVQTDTVTMKIAPPIDITEQPVEAHVPFFGETAEVSVKAVGEELSYLWYYKDAEDEEFTKSDCVEDTYALEITEECSGREVYCVITDKDGNTVNTDTVKMIVCAVIIEQPVDVAVSSGKTATISVSAVGEELTYQWYYKNPADSKFLAASGKSSTYSIAITNARNGRQMYCVITDKYGNKVQTETVTMTIG